MAATPPTNNSPQANLRTFLSIVKRVTRSFRSQSIQAQEQKQTQNNEQQIKRIASQLLRNYGNKSLMYLTKVHPGYRGLNNPQQVLDKLLSTYIHPDYKRVDRYIAAIEAGYESPQALALAEEEKQKKEEGFQEEKKKEKKTIEEKERKISFGSTKKQLEEEKKGVRPEETPPAAVGVFVKQYGTAPSAGESIYGKVLPQVQKGTPAPSKPTAKKTTPPISSGKNFAEKFQELYGKAPPPTQEGLPLSSPLRQVFGAGSSAGGYNQQTGTPPGYSQAGTSSLGRSLPGRLTPRFPSPRNLTNKIPKSLAGNLAKTAAKRYLLIPIIILALIIGFFTVLYPIFDNLLKAIPLLPAEPNACFNQGGGSCPSAEEIDANSQDQNTCKFLNPGIDIFDSSRPAGLQAYIDKYKSLFVRNYIRVTGASQLDASSEFHKRLDYILTRSEQVGLNPILFLTLWKSENDFSLKGDSVYHMGCMAGSLDFYSQVDCATGIGDVDSSLGEKNSRGEVIGSFSSRCASPKNPNRASACGVLEGIRASHPDIYPNDHSVSPFNNPIQTFDEWEESFGPHSPILNRPKTSTNNNCIHSYNLHIQIAELAGACKQGPINASSISVNSCKFYRADQTPTLYSYSNPDVKASFKGCPEGFRCEPGLTFSSSKLISYIDKVAKDTGVPASLLGAIVRIEATVPQHDTNDKSIWVQAPYSISDYTDTDIDYIEKEVASFGNDESKARNSYIPNTTKALCPYSSVGALGIMQMYSRTPTGDDLNVLKKYRPDKYPASASALTVSDYCDPLSNLYLGANLILDKAGSSWNPSKLSDRNYIAQITKSYLGANSADSDVGKMYEDSLFESITKCQVSQSSQTSGACYDTDGQRGDFKYFCQGNPSPWANYPYACETMAYAGCGPTSMAMILSSLGKNLNPQDVAKVFTANGWYVCGAGSAMGKALLDPRWLPFLDIAVGQNIVSNGAINLQAAQDAIRSGGYIIASSSNFPSCNCGHIVVIDSVNPVSGTVHVQDPICKFQNTPNIYSANPSGWRWNYAYPMNRVK